MQPGDFILVHQTGFFDKLIQFGQSLRFPKSESQWNHVALVVSPDGDLIEAATEGVKQAHISKYTQDEYKLVTVDLSPEDRLEACAFARSCINDGYNWAAFLSSAFCCLFGLNFQFGFSGEMICSGLVAKSLEHGGKILLRDADHCTPADLAEMFITLREEPSQGPE